MKKILKIISMMLMLSFFAVPMTACVSDSGYPEDEAFGKCGVTVTKSENYETDKQILINIKSIFNSRKVSSVTMYDTVVSSLGSYSVGKGSDILKSLSDMLDYQLAFELSDKEADAWYGPYFIVEYNNNEKIEVYYNLDKELIIATNNALYRCVDSSPINQYDIIGFVNSNRK